VPPKGFDVLEAKVPEFGTTAGRLRALLTVISSVTVGSVFFGWADRLFLGAAVLSQIIVLGVAWGLTVQIFLQRKWLRAQFGDDAYRRAIWRFGLPGLPLIFTAVVHVAFVGDVRALPVEWMLVPFIYLLVTGLLLFSRAVSTFGLDYLALVYVYFPGEGRLVNSEIYSALRHPVYSGVLRIALALGLWRGTWESLVLAVIMPLGLWGWITFIEEPELIERFGEGYRDYRRRVPAFFVWNPCRWGTLWRFLVAGK